jgi:hypothetical protein
MTKEQANNLLLDHADDLDENAIIEGKERKVTCSVRIKQPILSYPVPDDYEAIVILDSGSPNQEIMTLDKYLDLIKTI